MSTNRTKRSRRTKKYAIDETVEEFFLTGESNEGTQGHELRLGRFFDDDMIPEIWTEHKKRLIKKWHSEGVVEETWVQEYVRHESDPYQWYLDQKEGKKHGLKSIEE